MSSEDAKYFDLYTTGIGYLNHVREVTPKEGTPFLSVTVAALRGSVDDVRYTHFECRVSGLQARETVQQLRPAIEGKRKVLVGFTLSDPFVELFTCRDGEPGAGLKARLLRLGWVKIDGEPFYGEPIA